MLSQRLFGDDSFFLTGVSYNVHKVISSSCTLLAVEDATTRKKTMRTDALACSGNWEQPVRFDVASTLGIAEQDNMQRRRWILKGSIGLQGESARIALSCSIHVYEKSPQMYLALAQG